MNKEEGGDLRLLSTLQSCNGGAGERTKSSMTREREVVHLEVNVRSKEKNVVHLGKPFKEFNALAQAIKNLIEIYGKFLMFFVE